MVKFQIFIQPYGKSTILRLNHDTLKLLKLEENAEEGDLVEVDIKKIKSYKKRKRAK